MNGQKYVVLMGSMIAVSLIAIALATVSIWRQARDHNRVPVRLSFPTGSR